jgi:hypothetical protein
MCFSVSMPTSTGPNSFSHFLISRKSRFIPIALTLKRFSDRMRSSNKKHASTNSRLQSMPALIIGLTSSNRLATSGSRNPIYLEPSATNRGKLTITGFRKEKGPENRKPAQVLKRDRMREVLPDPGFFVSLFSIDPSNTNSVGGAARKPHNAI